MDVVCLLCSVFREKIRSNGDTGADVASTKDEDTCHL